MDNNSIFHEDMLNEDTSEWTDEKLDETIENLKQQIAEHPDSGGSKLESMKKMLDSLYEERARRARLLDDKELKNTINDTLDKYLKSEGQEKEELGEKLEVLTAERERRAELIRNAKPIWMREKDDAPEPTSEISEWDDKQLERSINDVLDKLLVADGAKKDALAKKLEKLTAERDKRAKHSKKFFQLRKKKHPVRMKLARNVFRTAKKIPKNLVNGFEKQNPLNQKIDKNSADNTGSESLKVAYRTRKKGIKIVKKTVKTTKKSIKVVTRIPKNTVKTVKFVNQSFRDTAKASIKAAKTTVRVVKFSWKVTKFVTIKTISLLMNPAFWVVACILAIVLYLGMAVLLLLGGGNNASQAMMQYAYTAPVALEKEFSEEYANAVQYWNIACAAKKTDFSALIDSFKYSTTDLTNSDLCNFYRNLPEPAHSFANSFATDNRKQAIKDEWNMQLTVEEAVAIAYVYLEIKENQAKGTTDALYPVTYTQETFNDIADQAAIWTDYIVGGMECPDKNCTKYQVDVTNPAWTAAKESENEAVHAYNEWYALCYRLTDYYNASEPAHSEIWKSLVWDLTTYLYTYTTQKGYPRINYGADGSHWNTLNDLGRHYENKVHYRESLPSTIKEDRYRCDRVHNLHSVSLTYSKAEAVMTALGFSDAEKEWEERIYQQVLASVSP